LRRDVRAPLLLLAYCLTPAPPAPTSTLSLHDALPISDLHHPRGAGDARQGRPARLASSRLRRATPAGRDLPPHRPSHPAAPCRADRKSTRLNSSHVKISYAVFCLKKQSTSR